MSDSIANIAAGFVSSLPFLIQQLNDSSSLLHRIFLPQFPQIKKLAEEVLQKVRNEGARLKSCSNILRLMLSRFQDPTLTVSELRTIVKGIVEPVIIEDTITITQNLREVINSCVRARELYGNRYYKALVAFIASLGVITGGSVLGLGGLYLWKGCVWTVTAGEMATISIAVAGTTGAVVTYHMDDIIQFFVRVEDQLKLMENKLRMFHDLLQDSNMRLRTVNGLTSLPNIPQNTQVQTEIERNDLRDSVVTFCDFSDELYEKSRMT